MHAVIAADGNEIGAVAGRLLVGGDIVLVELRRMCRRIHTGGDDAKERVAGGRQVVVIDDVAPTDQLDAGFVETAPGELCWGSGSLYGGDEDKQPVRPRTYSA